MAKNGLRSRNIFNPSSDDPFRLSRSKLELFLQCPLCFYLDRRLGVSRPEPPGYTLNTAVDRLLKREFDEYRFRGAPHPLLEKHGIHVQLFHHPVLENWRNNWTGIEYLHAETNFLACGAVDDIWVDDHDKLIVVDYKATSTEKQISIESDWRAGYRRQIEIYQWLLRQNGYPVSDVGYFVFANALASHGHFDETLHFQMSILPYKGDASWVDDALIAAHRCLMNDEAPFPTEDCEWCLYRSASAKASDKAIMSPSKVQTLF